MEKLLAQAQELVASLQEAKGKAVSAAEVLELRVDQTDKLKIELTKQKEDLDLREAKVAEAEKPAILLAKANELQALNKDTLDAINTAQKAFAKDRADFNSKSEVTRAELQAGKDLLTKELEVLKADRKQLEAAKKTYKDDVLNKLKAVK